jgi:hypothetical protein
MGYDNGWVYQISRNPWTGDFSVSLHSSSEGWVTLSSLFGSEEEAEAAALEWTAAHPV